MNQQPGITEPLPLRGRYLQFHLRPDGKIVEALKNLAERKWDESVVIGFGSTVFRSLKKTFPALRAFPVFDEALVEVPSTPTALWCFLRGDDPGILLHLGRELEELVRPAFLLGEAVDSFRYKDSRDLSGYIDGTENPEPDKIPEVTFVSSSEPGVDGGAFVSVQRWVHDLTRFDSWSQAERDNAIGRRQSDNFELPDAPPSAHVKRTAQESFTPEAFVLRRSMPYTRGRDEGLMFVAFGASLSPFEAQLRRMVGAEDGIVDALFRFSTPVGGAHFFCPPVQDGKLDLRALLIGD